MSFLQSTFVFLKIRFFFKVQIFDHTNHLGVFMNINFSSFYVHLIHFPKKDRCGVFVCVRVCASERVKMQLRDYNSLVKVISDLTCP